MKQGACVITKIKKKGRGREHWTHAKRGQLVGVFGGEGTKKKIVHGERDVSPRIA